MQEVSSAFACSNSAFIQSETDKHTASDSHPTEHSLWGTRKGGRDNKQRTDARTRHVTCDQEHVTRTRRHVTRTDYLVKAVGTEPGNTPNENRGTPQLEQKRKHKRVKPQREPCKGERCPLPQHALSLPGRHTCITLVAMHERLVKSVTQRTKA